jgi:hypothetical protein
MGGRWCQFIACRIVKSSSNHLRASKSTNKQYISRSFDDVALDVIDSIYNLVYKKDKTSDLI